MIVTLAQLFVTPLSLSGIERGILILPLCLAISIVYKVTRSDQLRDVPKAVLVLWVTIVVGMYAVGVGLWLLYSLMA